MKNVNSYIRMLILKFQRMNFTGRLTQDGGSPFGRSIQLLDNTRRMGRKLRSRGTPFGLAFWCTVMEEEILPISGESRCFNERSGLNVLISGQISNLN